MYRVLAEMGNLKQVVNLTRAKLTDTRQNVIIQGHTSEVLPTQKGVKKEMPCL
jgi:hypothetical protein